MTNKKLRCEHQGCRTLTLGRYCDKHRAAHPTMTLEVREAHNRRRAEIAALAAPIREEEVPLAPREEPRPAFKETDR